jgi:CheY-like chemotaxis protein
MPKGNVLQFFETHFILESMTQPLALVLYEKLLPGSQLANRLRDLNYRVQTLSDTEALVHSARQDKPLLALVDLVSRRENVCAAISQLRQEPETQHIPVIAFAPEKSMDLQRAAREAGANLVVSEAALLTHLDQFLEQALQIE